MGQLKKFRVKGNLLDAKTKADVGSKEMIAVGECGNDAIYNLREELKKEGVYELGYNYTYFEIGPAD